MQYTSELRVIDKVYDVVYTDPQGGSVQKRGRLLKTDEDGFVVLEVEGRYVLIKKDRVESMEQVPE